MAKLKKVGFNTTATLALPIVVYLIFVIFTRIVPDCIPFGSLSMILAIIQNSCMGILVAYALCVNMPTFRIDMSVGAVVILTGIISASMTIDYGLSIWVMLLISIVTAVGFSLITAICYVLLRIPMIVISLGMVVVYESLTGIVFGGFGVAALGANTRMLGYQPWCFILVAVGMIIFHVVTEHTRFAYETKLLAGGQALAVRIGIKENKNVLQSFLVAGLFLGLGAMVYVSNFGLIEVQTGMSSGAVLFDSLLPVLVGLSLARYSCNAVGIAIAVITMKTISYGMFCLGFNMTIQNVASGSFVLLLVIGMRSAATRHQRHRTLKRAKSLSAV